MAKEKVLVADDEAGARFSIRDFLELQGYEVDEADSCRKTLRSFRPPGRMRPSSITCCRTATPSTSCLA